MVVFGSLYSFLTITQIYQAFEDYDEVRAVSLDIHKVFENVWRDRLIFKLKQNCINGELMHFFENYLDGREKELF